MALDANALKNAAVTGATALVSYIALSNGGTEQAVTRQAVTWGTATAGKRPPSSDLTFTIPSGVTVDGWLGASASTAGTTYPGGSFTAVAFPSGGTLTLLKSGTDYTVAIV